MVTGYLRSAAAVQEFDEDAVGQAGLFAALAAEGYLPEQKKVAPRTGLEPVTNRLTVYCSTN